MVLSPQSHKPGQHSVFRIILEMFHVKHFCPVPAQPYKADDGASL
jgi:hypothetical protein